MCRTDQHLQETLPSFTAAKGGHTIYWKQKFTYFCNAQICNTRSFFSINKWQRKYFSLTCLIRFSLSTFRTCMKIWWCFGSYLCRNIENSKGFINFQAALYIYIYIHIYIYIYIYICVMNIYVTVMAKNVGTLGEYDQRRLWKWICIVNLLFFLKITKI